MKYQGIKNVNLPVNDDYAIETNFILTTQNLEYNFDIDTMIIIDQIKGEILLSETDSHTQKRIIKDSSIALEAYISEHGMTMLVDLASDNYLRALQLNDIKDR